MKIERILCPIDLLFDSGQALRYAARLARASGAKLIVCHCEDESAHADTPKRLEFSADIKGLIARVLKNSLSASDELEWETVLIEGAHPAEAITQEAARRNVDLIVMCSRRRPLRAALLGSTAEQVSRTAPCPVLVMHADERAWVETASETIQPRRVLVAHDFSDYSELALRYALTLAQEYEAELHLLHVLSSPILSEPELAWVPSSVENSYHKAARALQKAVPSEAYLWCKVKTAVCWGSKPYREILAYARENEIDLISMGEHGKGFGMQTLFGSNVDRVIRQSPCPVLIARPLKPVSPAFFNREMKSEQGMVM